MKEIIVALIADTNFGEKLRSIADKMPVWIIDSKVNNPIINELRKNKNFNITNVFRNHEDEIADFFLKVLFEIDDHHSFNAASSPYNTVYVYGVDVNLVDDGLISDLFLKKGGFIDNGFRLIKY